ncbi:MAG: hypothetical protein IPM69_12510 [Ignavibacteria bacterium]|nr:hypothetical protein [Ignavibacteria bacterium]
MRIATIVFLLIAVSTATSKPDSTFAISGVMSISSDMYSASADATAGFAPRRPSSLYRLVFLPEISIHGFRIPLALILSTPQTNTLSQIAPNQTFTQFLQNPQNVVSIAPKYKSLEVIAGTQTPQYSDLSVGNVPMFGLGVNFQPERFRIAAFAGTMQRAIEQDSASGTIGSFARRLYALKLGFGKRDEMYFDVNFARATDEAGSVLRRPTEVLPQEGVNLSLNSFGNLGSGLSLKGEIATSVFTRNTDSKRFFDSDISFLDQIIKVYEATRLDYAGSLALGLNQDTWGGFAQFRYIGDGFTPLGYLFFQSDIMEFSVAPYARFLDNSLSINASVGWRRDNLINTKSSTTSQLTYSLNTNWQIVENISLAGNFANYGLRNSIINDTFKVQNVARTFSITPTVTFGSESIRHTVSATVSLDEYSDLNPLTGNTSSTKTRALFGSYSLALQDPFIGSVSIGNVTNTYSYGDLSVNSVSVGGSYGFLNKDIVPMLTLGYTSMTLSNFTPDTQVFLRLSCSARIVENIRLQVLGTLNMYSYGTSRQGAGFTENFLQTTLSTPL